MLDVLAILQDLDFFQSDKPAWHHGIENRQKRLDIVLRVHNLDDQRQVLAHVEDLRAVQPGRLAKAQWTPPGNAAPNFEYHFCKNCGIRTPSRGVAEALGGVFHAIQVTLLDDVNPDELAGAPIQYVDGRNDQFDRPPADTRLL